MTGHLPYTEEDVELVRAAVVKALSKPGELSLGRTVLDALSSANRLVPPGWRRDTEWAVEEPGTTTWTSEPYYRREHAERERRRGQHVVRRPIVAGPWSPSVPDTEEGTSRG